MSITEIRIYPVMKNGILANASVTLDDEFAVKVTIRGKKDTEEPFVCFPSHSYEADGERKYVDDFFPITKEAREYFCNAVIKEFCKAVATDKPKAKTAKKKW